MRAIGNRVPFQKQGLDGAIKNLKSMVKRSLSVLLLVFKNCYLLIKEVATNTRPWGQEITIQIYHLRFHIDFSFTETTRAQFHLFSGIYPKFKYHLFPPITFLHFFGLRPFASRWKPRTLEFAYVLNAGTVHDGAPFYDFSIFASLHAFLGIFFIKNWNLQP
jgi:hypothetical protein